ncbi:MAG TPA: aminotransferase class V-fold PLP-dependent enzyme, partial [Accumulibacter sp.]|nr:aminotransferase class V-fold PLP-dependent enzyme [Accumulibacter sp.]
MFAPVYLDHNATTPVDPAVREAMLPYLSGQYGNASSRHEYGRAARRAIDEARSKVAA